MIAETQNLGDASHHLLLRIEKADRRFRAAQTLFFFLTAALLIVISVLLLQQASDAKQEIAATNKTVAAQQKTLDSLAGYAAQRTQQINDLQNHIDCIVELFQQPNRANFTINNLQGCQITANGISDTSAKSSSVGPVPSTPTTPPTKQPTTSEPPKASTPTRPSTPVTQPESWLDKLPLVGGLFKALGV